MVKTFSWLFLLFISSLQSREDNQTNEKELFATTPKNFQPTKKTLSQRIIEQEKFQESPRTPRPEYSQLLSEPYVTLERGYVSDQRLLEFLAEQHYISPLYTIGKYDRPVVIREVGHGTYSQQVFLVYERTKNSRLSKYCIKILDDKDGCQDTQTFIARKTSLRHIKDEFKRNEGTPRLITPLAYYLFMGWDNKTHHLQIHKAAKGKSLDVIIKEARKDKIQSASYAVGKAIAMIQKVGMIYQDKAFICNTHGDAHPGNIYFSIKTGIVSFIDLTETKYGSPFDDILSFYLIPLFYWNKISEKKQFYRILRSIPPFFQGYFDVFQQEDYFSDIKDFVLRVFEAYVLRFQNDLGTFRDKNFESEHLKNIPRKYYLSPLEVDYFDKVRGPLKDLYVRDRDKALDLEALIHKRCRKMLAALAKANASFKPKQLELQ